MSALCRVSAAGAIFRGLGILVLASMALWAQSDSARLQGTVYDATGAFVPGAKVTVTNLGTNREFSQETAGDTGIFSFPALPPGEYKLIVNKESFKSITQQLTLQNSQVANLTLKLETGAVSESVTISDQAALVDSATSDVGSVIQGRQITELPLNGRNFTQLATLVPGVTRGVADGQASGAGGNAETFRNGNTGGAALSVNGMRPQANNFMLDGLDNNESLVNTIIFFPPAEAMQEFRVETSVAPAEYGRAGGGIVSSTIKSGTNEYHGSAFEFLRNSELDARPTFASSRTPFKRNQFGGTLGGPIIKNKWFAFGDYQGLRQDLPLSIDYVTVPTQAMRTGDFSALLNTATSGLPQTYVIRDVSTGLPYANNVIPSSLFNKSGQNYLNAFPLPNVTDRVQQNYIVQRKQVQHFNDFDIRSDYVLGDKDSLFGRFSYGKDSSDTSSRFANLPAGYGSGTNINYPWSVVVGETHTFSPTVLNEFRAGFIRTKYGYQPPFADTPISANLGIPNANTSSLLGGGALIGGGGSQLEYTGDYGPYLVPQNTWQAADSITKIAGRHTFKAGVNIIRRQVNLYRPNRGKGFFSLFSNGIGLGSTGYEVADVLGGFVSNYTIGPPYGMVGTRSWETGYYFQDDWRVSRRLTLNLGIRYDYYTWPSEVAGRQTNFDPSTGRLIQASGGGDSLVNPDRNNFAPRFGFAYDASGDGKTVIRGGYGIFYFVDRGGIDNQLAQNPPYSGFSSYDFNQGYRVTLSGLGPMGSGPTGGLNWLQATGALPTGSVSGIDLNNPQNVTVFAALKNNRNSYVQQWNLQVQREVMSNTVWSAGYVGTSGHRLASYYNLNRQLFNSASGVKLFPQLGDVNVQDTRGNSIYHSLQTQLERRFSKGFQFRASYTWSKAIDDSQGAFDATQPQDFRNLALERSLSSMDQRHRFVLSGLYELPFGRGKAFGSQMNPVLNTIAGGWQLNGIVTFASGLPFNVSTPGNPGSVRPDLNGPVAIYSGNANHYFDTSMFSQVPVNADGILLRPGTAGRNILIGPGTKNLDLSAFKNFQPIERLTVQFRAEAYNLTNTPQYANPNGDITSADFGRIRNTLLSSERQIQFALRLMF